MQLVQDRDGKGARPFQNVFEAQDQPVLEAVCATLEGETKNKRTEEPTPEGIPRFSSMGMRSPRGWTEYYGKPGPVVMLRGLYQFRSIQLGYETAADV